MLAIGLSAAGAQSLAPNGDFAQAAADGTPVAWTVTPFHGSQTPGLEIVPAAEGQAGQMLQVTMPESAYTCVSVHCRLPELDMDRTARLRFRYRFVGEASPAKMATFAVSAGEGCMPPLYRHWFSLAPAGTWQEVSQELGLAGLRESGNVLEFILENPGDQYYQAGDQFCLAQVSLEYLGEPAPLRLGFTAAPSGVVFTDEPVRLLSGSLHLPRQHRGQTARVSLYPGEAGQSALHSVDLPTTAADNEWELDVDGLAAGRYRVVAEALDAQGRPVARAERAFTIVAPDPDRPRVRGNTIYYRGKPFLPLGLYHVTDWTLGAVNAENRELGLPEVTRDEMLAGIAEHGFNVITYADRAQEDYLRAAAAHGLLAVPSASLYGELGETLRGYLRPFAADPRLFGWYGWDEPTAGPSMAIAQEIYRTVKEVSPQSLVMLALNTSSGLQGLTPVDTPADLLAVDGYYIRKPDSDLGQLGRDVRATAEFVRGTPGLVAGVVPQAFVYDGPEPTVAQLRAQTYLAVVNGARAFFFYSYIEDYGNLPFTQYQASNPDTPSGMSRNPQRTHWWLPDSDMWEAFPALNAELRSLEDFLLNDGEPVDVTVAERPVQWAAKRVGSRAWFIAVNPTGQAQAVTASFPQATHLTGLFGTVAPEGAVGELALEFAPYEAKVFELGE